MVKKIGVIEDDAALCASLKTAFPSAELVIFHDVIAPFQPKEFESLDALLVDEILPSGSGVQFVAQMREAGIKTPVIFMSGEPSVSLLKKIINVGAHRFLEKPFLLDELKKALEEICGPHLRVIACDLNLDERAKLIYYRGVKLELTAVEFSLISTLALSPGTSFSREEIVAEIWGKRQVSRNILDTNLFNLRQKYPMLSQHIHNHRGIGYRWAES